MPAFRLYLVMLLAFATAGCSGIPENVSPITGFNINRYLGTWYEIARLDHSFERGLEQVTAEYSLRDDGGVRVVNQGYNRAKERWARAEGKACFIGSSDVGRLKVSFFGPFFGGYNIIDLDKEHYRYSLVCGPDRSYLWILARQPVIDKPTLEQIVAKASRSGFDTKRLIFVAHGKPEQSHVTE